MFSRLIGRQAAVIERNDILKNAIFQAFDKACEENRRQFMEMWTDFMDSMFQSPMVMLKSCSTPKIGDSYEEEIAPTFESTKERINEERSGRNNLKNALQDQIKKIPDEDSQATTAVKLVQKIVEQTFGVIRCQVADQMQLYSESFFLLPMLRRLEGNMAVLELADDDKARFRARMAVLVEEDKFSTGIVEDVRWSIEAVQKYKITCGGAGGD